MGRDGQGAEPVGQIVDTKAFGFAASFPLPKGEGALAKRGRVRGLWRLELVWRESFDAIRPTLSAVYGFVFATGTSVD